MLNMKSLQYTGLQLVGGEHKGALEVVFFFNVLFESLEDTNPNDFAKTVQLLRRCCEDWGPIVTI